MSQITPLPTPPSRSRPSSFSTEADSFLAALPTFVSEANVVASEVSSNSTQASLDADRALEYRDAAFAATNFKGVWSELTGALIIPSSVLHNSKLWMLTENIADVTSVEPGVSSLWFDVTFPKVGFSGLWSGLSGSVTTPNLVLHNSLLWSLSEDLLDVTAHEPGVSSSWVEVQSRLGGKSVVYSADATLDLTAVQWVSTDVSGIVLTLPVFTVADEGRILIIYNEGDFAFHVYTSSGSRITFLSPSSSSALRILLVDSATQKLALSYLDLTPQSSLYWISGPVNVLSTAATEHMLIQLSADRALVVMKQSLSNTRGYLLELGSSDVIVHTKGEATEIPLLNHSGWAATLVSEHKVLICYREIAAARTYAVIVSTSEDTVVTGTPLLLTGGNSYSVVSTLSSDKAFLCYRDNVSGNVNRSGVLTVSGTTVTVGTLFTITDAGVYGPVLAFSLSSSVVLLAYNNTTNTQCSLRLLSVTGTTVSLLSGSTPVIFSPGERVIYAAAIFLDTERILFSYTTSGGNKVCIMTVSGTTITIGDVLDTGTSGIPRLAKLSSTRVILGTSSFRILDIEGMSVSLSSPPHPSLSIIGGVLPGNSDDEIITLAYTTADGSHLCKLFLGIL